MMTLGLEHPAGRPGEGKGKARPKEAANFRVVPPPLHTEERREAPCRRGVFFGHHPIHRGDERDERLPRLVAGPEVLRLFGGLVRRQDGLQRLPPVRPLVGVHDREDVSQSLMDSL